MFPNFSSKADREQKHHDLLARVALRNKQDEVKRGMYAEVIWASEADKLISTTKPTEPEPVMTQIDPSKKTDPEQKASVIPAVITEPSEVPEEPSDEPPVPPEALNLSFDTSQVESSDAAQETIQEWFRQHPELADLRVSPIRVDGSPHPGYVLGKRGLLYSTRTKRVGRPRGINWLATLTVLSDRALEHTQVRVNNAIDRIEQFYIAHPEYVSIKFRPINAQGVQSTLYHLGERGRLIDNRTGRPAIVSYNSPEAVNWIATDSMLYRLYSDGESNSIDELATMRMFDQPAPPAPPIPSVSPASYPSAPPAPPPSPRSVSSPPPTRSLTLDEASELLEHDQDQRDSEVWVRHWLDEHPGETLEVVNNDWVAAHNLILDRYGPGLSSEQLMQQLDEQARQLQSTEPELTELLDEASDEVAQSELNDQLAVLQDAPPSERRRSGMVERALTLLRQSRSIVSRANRDRYLTRTRAEMTAAIQEVRELNEMTSNDYNVLPPTNNKRRRTETVEEAMLRSTKDNLQSTLSQITARNFYSRSQPEKLRLVEQATAYLNQLKGRIPHDVFRSHYQTIGRVMRRLIETSATDRSRRNAEETQARLMGVPSPAIPAAPATPAPPAPPAPPATARATLRRIVNNRDLMRQLVTAQILIVPIRHNGEKISGMIIRAPKKRAGDLQFVIPTDSERSKPSYERQIDFDATLARVARLARAKQIDIHALNSHLTGRGLRGAGKSMYQTVERRSKYYNLNDIRGTGLASAYIYQPIGSKYIRIPDIESNRLNIVYPSRKKLGPLRDISDAVKQMLKDVIYDGKLSQAAYDKLSIPDKKLFKEILAATHVQHGFKDPLPDATEALRAEYDKLRGELMMGNNSLSIKAQLKSLVVYMYSKLIDHRYRV